MSSRRVHYNTLFIFPALVLSGGAICYWKNILNVVHISESCSALFLILLFVARLFYVYFFDMATTVKSEDLAKMLGSSASSASTPAVATGSATVTIPFFDGTGDLAEWCFQANMALVAKYGAGMMDVFEIPPPASMRVSDNTNAFLAFSMTTRGLALQIVKATAIGRADLVLAVFRREFSKVRPEHAPQIFQSFLQLRLEGTQTAAYSLRAQEILRNLVSGLPVGSGFR